MHPWLARFAAPIVAIGPRVSATWLRTRRLASVLSDSRYRVPAPRRPAGGDDSSTIQRFSSWAVPAWRSTGGRHPTPSMLWRTPAGALTTRHREPRSLRARLTRTDWPISTEGGMTAELVNFFDPWIVDERRDADVWERARAAAGAGPPNASASDVAVAALTDQLDLAGAVRWALGAAAVLDAVGENVSLRPVLDRPARTVGAPVVVSRLQLLVRRGAESKRGASSAGGPGVGRSASPADNDAGAGVRLGSAAGAGFGPSADCGREIVARHGGLAGVRDVPGAATEDRLSRPWGLLASSWLVPSLPGSGKSITSPGCSAPRSGGNGVPSPWRTRAFSIGPAPRERPATSAANRA